RRCGWTCGNSWRRLEKRFNDSTFLRFNDPMRAEKQFITTEYVNRLNSSPFFIVVDYVGLTVGQFSELRKRLRSAGSEVHVVKNSIFRVAAKEAGLADLSGSMAGQMAVVT